MKFTALILIGAAALAHAGPIDSTHTCAAACDAGQTKFRYETGKTYMYDYEGQTMTKIEGASEEISGLHIKANSKIHAISTCELQLTLSEVRLSHLSPQNANEKTRSPVAAAFAHALEAKSLRFAFNGGKVEHICSGTDTDEPWVLNIKRGIISSLQNTMADLVHDTVVRETDVLGACDTAYKVTEGGIIKTKDLLGCTNRDWLQTVVPHGHYHAASGVQAIPLLKSEQQCKQIIKNNIINSVECSESHIVRAFSNGESGAVTNLRSQLVLKSVVTEEVETTPVTVAQSLMFDLTKSTQDIKEAEVLIKKIVTEACAAGEVLDKSPEQFGTLIKNIQKLNKEALNKVHAEIRGKCQLGKKTFYDALPVAGTPATVALMREILLSGAAPSKEMEMWKSAIAFMANPNAEVIAELTPLLAQPDRQVYLSASSLVHRFCSEKEDCVTIAAVRDFVMALEAKLGETDKETITMTLKALGNTRMAVASRNILVQIILNEKIPYENRLAALEAFHHIPLLEAKPQLVAIYKDREMDSEIRIGAFVALMHSPCQMVLDAVQETMANEKMLQVGSFVMTYMENAQKTDNPMKQAIKAAIQDFDVSKITRDWNLERMKYSRSYEASYFSNLLNAGVDAESHVIFSKNGFLPHQVKTDLTVNLFGRSVDLLEVGGHMDGLEQLLEYYFGPEGALNKNTHETRAKRAVMADNKINQIHEKVNARTVMKETKGQMYLKMFGSELHYLNFDLDSLLSRKDNINVLEFLKSIANRREAEYTENFQVFDLAYTIPTGLGLPLKLDLHAHGSFHLKAGGKIDLMKFMKPPRSMEIDGYIKPSAAIEVKTTMGIDAFVTKTGVKMVGNMHTSTAFEGKLMINDGKIFKLHYAMPKQELEIFHGMTKFFVMHHTTEREQRMITQDVITLNKCTGDRIATVTGLALCGELTLPNASQVANAPWFPLTGPINARIVINKRDAKLMSYDAEIARTSSNGVETAKVILDTPGSEINRELSMIMNVDTRQKSFELNLRSPWKKIGATASLLNEASLKRINAKVVVDEKRTYASSITLQIQSKNGDIKYIPGLELNIHGMSPVTLKGSITIEKSNKIMMDLALENVAATPITLKGAVEKIGNKRINSNIAFTSPLITYKHIGFIERKKYTYAVRSDCSFRFKQLKEHKMIFNGNAKFISKPDTSVVKLETSLKLSAFPEYPLALSVDFKRTSNDAKLDVEATLKKNMEPLKLNVIFMHKRVSPMSMKAKAELSFPGRKMFISQEIDESPKKTFKSVSIVSWAEGQQFKADYTFVDTTTRATLFGGKLDGFVVAPFMDRIDTAVSAMIASNAVDTILMVKLANTKVYKFETKGKKENGHFSASGLVFLNGEKYEANMITKQTKTMTDIHMDMNLNGKPTALNLKVTHDNKAVNIHSDLLIFERKYEANINGEMKAKSINAHADVIVEGKKIESNVNLFSADGTMRANAEVKGLALLKLKVSDILIQANNVMIKNDLKTNFKIMTNQDTICDFSLSGKMVADEINGQIQLTTPIKTINGNVILSKKEGYSAKASVVIDGRKMKLETKLAKHEVLLDVNWNENEFGNRVAIASKWNEAGNKDKQQFTTESTIVLPLIVFPAPIKTTTLVSKDIRGIYSAEVIIDYGFKFELKASHSFLPSRINTKVEINTPIEEWEQMSAEMLATLVDRRVIFNADAIKNKKVLLQVRLDANVIDTEIIGKFSLLTPFEMVKSLSAEFNYNYKGIKLIKCNGQITLNTKKIASYDFNHKDMAGKLIVTLPIDKYETTLLEYSLVRAKTSAAKIQLIFGENQQITWTAQNQEKRLGFTFVTSLSASMFKTISLDIDHKYNHMRLLSNNVVAKCGDKEITFKAQLSRKAAKSDLILELKHPYNPEGLALEAELNDNNHGKNLDGAVKLRVAPGKTIVMSMYMKKESWLTGVEGKAEITSPFFKKVSSQFGWHMMPETGVYKSSFNVEYSQKRITFEESLIIKTPNIEFTTKITTPFKEAEILSYTFKTAGTVQSMKTHSEIQLNAEKISTDFELNFENMNNMEGSVIIKSPLAGYEVVKASVSNKGLLKNMHSKISLVLNSKEVKLDSLIKHENIFNTDSSIKISTPSKVMTFSLSNKGEISNMKTRVAVVIPQYPVSLEFDLKFKKISDMESMVKIALPVKDYETTIITLSNKGAWENKEAKLALTMKRLTYEATIASKIVSLKEIFTSIDINMAGKETLNLEFTSKGDLRNLKTDLVFIKNGKAQSLDLMMKLADVESMEAKLIVKTLFKGFEKSVISFSNKGKIENMKTNAMILFMNKKATFTSAIKFTDVYNMEATIELVTPFTGMEVTTLSAKNKGRISDMTTKVDFNKKFTFTSSIKFINVYDMEAAIKLVTPFTGMEVTTLSASNKGKISDMTTKVDFNKKTTFTSAIKYNNVYDMEAAIKLVTPFTGMEVTTLSASNKGRISDMTTNVEFNKKTVLNSNIKFVDIFNMEGTIIIPAITLKASNKGKLNNMNSMIHFDMPNHFAHTAESSIKYISIDDMEFSFSYKTPKPFNIFFTKKGNLKNLKTELRFTSAYLPAPISAQAEMKFNDIFDMAGKIVFNGLDIIFEDGLGIEKIVLTCSNSGRSLNPLTTVMSFTWAEGKTITYTTKLKFVSIKDMEGEVTVTTPWTKYERVGFTWSNKAESQTAAAKFVLEFQTNQKLDVEGFVRKIGDRIEAKLTFTTPYEKFDKIVFALDHTGSFQKFQGFYSIVLPHIRKMEMHLSSDLALAEGIRYDGSIRMDTIFLSTTTLTTHFSLVNQATTLKLGGEYGLKRGEFVFNGKLSGSTLNRFKIEADATLSGNVIDKYAVATILDFSHDKTKTSLNLKFNQKEVIVFSFTQSRQGNALMNKMTYTQAMTEVIPRDAETILNFDISKSEGMIVSELKINKKLFNSLAIEYAVTGNKVEGKVVETFKDNRGEISVTATMNGKEAAIVGAIKTGKTLLTSIKVQYTIAKETSRIHVEGSFKNNMAQTTLVFSRAGKSTSFSTELKLNGEIIIAGKVEYALTKASFSTSVEGTFKGKTAIVHATFIRDGKTYKLACDVALNKGRLFDCDIELALTKNGFSTAIEGSFKGNTAITHATFNINDKTYKLACDVAFNKEKLFECSLELALTATGFSTAIEGTFKGKTAIAHATFNVNDKTYKLTCDAAFNKANLFECGAELALTKTGFSTAIDGKFKRQSGKFVLSFTNDKIVKVETELQFNNKQLLSVTGKMNPLNGMKLEIILKQQLTRDIPSNGELSFVANVAKTDSAITFVIKTESKPVLGMELTHTMNSANLNGKVTGFFKASKGEANLSITRSGSKAKLNFNVVLNGKSLTNFDGEYTFVAGTLSAKVMASLDSHTINFNIMLSTPKSALRFYVKVNEKSILDIDTEYRLEGADWIGLKAKVIYEDSTILDLESFVKSNPKDAEVQIKSNGRQILGATGSLNSQNFDFHLMWKDESIACLKMTFKPNPILLSLEAKYRTQIMLTFNGKLDLSGKSLDVVFDMDPILMKAGISESWVLALKGKITEQRGRTNMMMEASKAGKKIVFDVAIVKAGAIDFTFRPARCTIDAKISSNTLKAFKSIGLTVQMNKNTGTIRTAVGASLDEVQMSDIMVEYKNAQNTHNGKIEVKLPTLDIKVGTIAELKLNSLIEYSFQIISDLTNVEKKSITLSGSMQDSDAFKTVTFKTIIPGRVMEFRAINQKRDNEITNEVDFSWAVGKHMGYKAIITDKSDFELILTHPIRTARFQGKVRETPRLYAIDLICQPDMTKADRKTIIKFELNNQSNGPTLNYKLITSFDHPDLEKPLTLTAGITLNRGKILFATSFELIFSKFERKTIAGSFRLSDESSNEGKKHSFVADLKQLSNFIDIRVQGSTKGSPNGFESEAVFNYLTSKREVKTLKTELALKKGHYSITVETPTMKRQIFVTLEDKSSEAGKYVHIIVTDIKDGVRNAVLDALLNEHSRQMVVRFLNTRLEAKIHEKYMFEMTIRRSGKTDFFLKTSLTDMLVNTKCTWNTNLLEDMKTEIPQMVGDVATDALTMWNPIMLELVTDVQTKTKQATSGNFQSMKPMLKAGRQFLKAMEKDVDAVIKGMKQMYKKNEFFLKDIGMATTSQAKKMISCIEKCIERIETEVLKLESLLKAKITLQIEACLTCIKKMQDFRPIIEAKTREVMNVAHRLIIAMKPKFMEFIRIAGEKVAEFDRVFVAPLKRKLTELKARFTPVHSDVKNGLIRFFERIETINFKKAIIDLKEKLMAHHAETSVYVIAYLEELNDKLEAKLKELEAYPYIMEIKMEWETLKAKAIWAWKYLDIQGEITRHINDAAARRERFWQIIENNKSHWISQKMGHVEFDIEIPFELKGLVVLPTFEEFIMRLKEVKRSFSSALPKVRWTPMDYYYYYKPQFMHLPPFPAQAMVAGNQHFFTFDGKFYEFAGECSYVLARDFTDDKFSVIINYRRTKAGPMRHSISVMSNGKTAEIFQNFRTVVDRANVDLPVSINGMSIKRSGNQLQVSSSKGINVACNMDTEICTVSMSGWYFGKTGGLLGSYDYEPETDIVNPMGRKVDSIEKFANTWEVAKFCRNKINQAEIAPVAVKDTPAYEVCAAIFEDDSLISGSPLRKAFRVVDPTPFMTMCINDVYKVRNTANKDLMTQKACAAIDAYIIQARYHGIPIEAPATCLRCQKSDGSFMHTGDAEKIMDLKTADVLVVVEEGPCNKNRRKDLLTLVKETESTLVKAGITGNRYGLAAFGGDDIHDMPHSHTIEGQLWNNAVKFVRGVRSLDFADQLHEDATVEDAIMFAANVQWRAGATRNIVLMPCKQCSADTEMYQKMKTALTKFGIRLHIVGESKKTEKAKDICTPLAQESKGSVTPHGTIFQSKMATAEFATRLAGGARAATCQICECVVVDPFQQKTMTTCRHCDS